MPHHSWYVYLPNCIRTDKPYQEAREWRHSWKGRSGALGAAGDGPGALLVWGESIKLPTGELCTFLDFWTCNFLMGVLKFSCHGCFLSRSKFPKQMQKAHGVTWRGRLQKKGQGVPYLLVCIPRPWPAPSAGRGSAKVYSASSGHRAPGNQDLGGAGRREGTRLPSSLERRFAGRAAP